MPMGKGSYTPTNVLILHLILMNGAPLTHKKKKGLRSLDLNPLISLAGPMGLEPTASGVTGR